MAGSAAQNLPVPRDTPFTAADWDRLPERQRFFIAEYLVDFNATRAARSAGYKKPTEEGYSLLRKPQIAAAVEYAVAQRSVRTLIKADDVLKMWFVQATADPAELVSYVSTNCRHCWGIENRYQWHEVEFLHACEKYDEEREAFEQDHPDRTFRKKAPDERGGFGFDPNREPNPACPHCSGRGEERVQITPTDKLSPGAKAIYAGVRQTKNGPEVLMKDQAKALENVARHLGMFSNDAPFALIQNNIQNNVGKVRRIERTIVRPSKDEDDE